jgi:EmrB/QacA subfamily drug resistance transporter
MADVASAESPLVVRRGTPPVALATLCTLLFLTFLDNTVVSVALGDIQTEFHAGVSTLQWIVGGYALTFAGGMLACGMLGDRFGRKTVMLTGGGVFCIGSVLAAVAPNSTMLIVGRVVMGLGAAASEPGTLSMLRHLYPQERPRTRAIGIWAGVSGLALALGPVIGGALVGLWDWRAIFWFNLVLGLFAIIGAAVVLPESVDPQTRRVDIAGTVLSAGALTALVFAVITGESAGFTSPHVLTLFGVAAVGAVLFVLWERRVTDPLLSLRLLRNPRFTTGNIVAFCTYFATFAIFFFTALYLNEIAGFNGYQMARLFIPMTVLMIVASVLAGRWVSDAAVRWWTASGCVIFAGGLLLTIAVLNPQPNTAQLAGALALAGIGVGITVVPVTSSVLGAAPAQQSGMAASAANTSREIGAVTGVAVLGALTYAQLNADLTARLNELGVPPQFQSIVITAVETGGVPSNGNGTDNPAAAGQGDIVQKVINAAYKAFETGLHASLYLSAGLMLVAAVLAATTLRPRPTAGGATEPSVGTSTGPAETVAGAG